MKVNRVFLIVLDSFGIGEMPDADRFGDKGSNTLAAISKSRFFSVPNLTNMGLFNIDGITCGKGVATPTASYAKMAEQSNGKDTTTGHWEIAGIISQNSMPVYPNGFPNEIIEAFEKATGRGVLCNRPYSGTQVIRDYGEEHKKTGKFIVYTSADSVFQIAAHEQVIPLEELYHACEIARGILTGKHAVGRVIARPFVGEYPNYTRTPNRHDYSLKPPSATMLDILKENAYAVIGVGKINDIFASQGITETYRTVNNDDGMQKTFALQKKDFAGLCFVNLVDFDMLYGHRNDVDGYAKAMSQFDMQLGQFLQQMRPDDVLMITADHGCDPSTESTDHSREYTPLIIYSKQLKSEVNLGIRNSFADIAKTILDLFALPNQIAGTSFFDLLKG